MNAFIAPLALILERRLGYSQRLVAAIGHPVMWFGWVIDYLETRLNTDKRSDAERKQAGMVALATLV